MTKNEYLDELRKELSSLPFSEQEDAVRYYEEYFDDAGEENEQHVIEELGSPADLDRNIIANAGSTLPTVPHAPFQTQSPQTEKKKYSTTFWLLVILTSFLWIPVAATVLSIILSIIIIIFSIFITVSIMAITFLFSGICTLILAIPVLPSADAMLLIGLSLLYFGSALLMGILTYLLTKYFFPWCWKKAKHLGKSIPNAWKKYSAKQKG